MVRSCHLDTCPVGIASQRPELRAKFAGTPEMVEAYLRFVALEVRELLARLGLRTLDEAVGRVDLLRQRRTGDPSADALDLGAAPRLDRPGSRPVRRTSRSRTRAIGSGRSSSPRARPRSAARGSSRPRTRSRTPTGRSAPAWAARSRRPSARPPRPAAFGRDSRARRARASARSSRPASTSGSSARRTTTSGRRCPAAVSSSRRPSGDVGDPCLLGNTVLYGATGGELFCAGAAGERFAVRNSGALAVVEGVGDHGCEYMTRGTVVVLGPHGRNLGAGMTGGEAFLLDPDERLVNDELVDARPARARRARAPRRAPRPARPSHRLGRALRAARRPGSGRLAASAGSRPAARSSSARHTRRAASRPRRINSILHAYYADAVRQHRRLPPATPARRRSTASSVTPSSSSTPSARTRSPGRTRPHWIRG